MDRKVFILYWYENSFRRRETGRNTGFRQIYKEVKKVAKIELKQPVVEEISANLKDAQSVVLVDHRGLTVEQDTRLRKELREAGITYKVYKNTMMNFPFICKNLHNHFLICLWIQAAATIKNWRQC